MASSLYWEIAEELAERSEQGDTHRQLADETGRPRRRVSEFIQVHRQVGRSGEPTFSQAIMLVKDVTPEGERVRKDASAARKILRDPEQRTKVIADLHADEIEAVITDANAAAIDRERAKRAEQQTEPTVRELMGGDRFDPAEYRADTLIIRTNRNARELASLIKAPAACCSGR